MSTDHSPDRDPSTPADDTAAPTPDGLLRKAPTWHEVLHGAAAPQAGDAPVDGARSRLDARLDALPAWSASYLARRHACPGGEPLPGAARGEGGRHRGAGRGTRTARRHRQALSDHRLVTAPTGPTRYRATGTDGARNGVGVAPPWWWLLAPHAARRLAARPGRRPEGGGAGTGGWRPERPRRATLLLTSMLAVAALLGPLVAAGPVGSVAAGALPPADDGPLGATGALPDFFTPPGDLPGASGPSGANPAPGVDAGAGVAGIPAGMLVAYRRAETNLAGSAPSCRLGWALVAAIGKVESSHARGGALDANGTTLSPILGPRLDGSGANAAIPDTDGGAYDGDTVWDRAVGPTQFIPSTWQAYGVDANNDGRADPNNAHDATTATGRYLCAGGLDLADSRQLHDAVFRYNHSESYVNTVLSWARIYASGATATPDATRTPDTDTGRGAPTGSDPLTLAAASAALPANAPVPAAAGPADAPDTATAAVPSAAGPASPAAGGQPFTPTTLAPTTVAPTTSTPRSTINPAPASPVPGTAVPPRPVPSSPAPGRPTVTTPPRPSTPGGPGGPGAPATTSTVPSTTSTSAEQACRSLTPAQVAEAFGLPPGTVSRSSDAAGCQFRGPGGLLLTLDVTQSNQSTRMSDRSVMKSGQGRQLVISFGGRDQLRLTVPGDASPTPTSAQAGLGAVAARLM